MELRKLNEKNAQLPHHSSPPRGEERGEGPRHFVSFVKINCPQGFKGEKEKKKILFSISDFFSCGGSEPQQRILSLLSD